MRNFSTVMSDAVLALGAVVLAFVVSAFIGPAHAQDKSESVSPKVGRPLNAAQDLLKAQRYADALAKLQEVDAISGKTPYETYIMERMRASAAVGAGDTALAEKSFNAVLASDQLPADEKAQVIGSMAVMFYRAKDYPKTAQWATRYLAAGGSNPQLREVLIQSLYLSNDFAGAARELQVEFKADAAAGKVPAEDRIQLLASSYLKAKDDAGYTSALELMVASHPNRDYWADLINRVQKKPGFANRLSLDVFRLQRATAGLSDASDFMEMAQLAVEAGFPIEAKKILDEGFSAKVLGTGPDAPRQQRLRDAVNKQAAEDTKVLAQGQSPGAAAKDGTGYVNVGLDYVINGQFDTGLPLMEQGIAKGGLKQPEDAKLRLGMAYFLAGQKDKAIQVFKTVPGTDGTADLARLWILHAQRS